MRLLVHMLWNVGLSDLREDLAAKLDQVMRGDTILIERRGKVIAKIVPVDEPSRQPSWKRKITPIKMKGGSVDETIRYIRGEGAL